jgi:large subunit ribosomal protein L24e
MDIHECTFCKTEIEPGTGKMFVKRDGSLYYFCSSKCEKNMLKLGRVARKTEWTRPVKPKKRVKRKETEKIEKKILKKKTRKPKKAPAKKAGRKKGVKS